MAGLVAKPVDHFADLRELGADALTPDAFFEALERIEKGRASLDVATANALMDLLGRKLGIDRLAAITEMCGRCIEHFSHEGNDTSNPLTRNREHGKRNQWMQFRSHTSAVMIEQIKMRR